MGDLSRSKAELEVDATRIMVAPGFINSVGNLGGFFGPYVVGYLDKRTGSFSFGIIYLSFSALVAAILIVLVRHSTDGENAKHVPDRRTIHIGST